MSTEVVLFKEITGGYIPPIIQENKPKYRIQEKSSIKKARESPGWWQASKTLRGLVCPDTKAPKRLHKEGKIDRIPNIQIHT